MQCACVTGYITHSLDIFVVYNLVLFTIKIHSYTIILSAVVDVMYGAFSTEIARECSQN
jgi:Na+/H+-dicarboxylate symporter